MPWSRFFNPRHHAQKQRIAASAQHLLALFGQQLLLVDLLCGSACSERRFAVRKYVQQAAHLTISADQAVIAPHHRCINAARKVSN
jgi:hypothetical protein